MNDTGKATRRRKQLQMLSDLRGLEDGS